MHDACHLQKRHEKPLLQELPGPDMWQRDHGPRANSIVAVNDPPIHLLGVGGNARDCTCHLGWTTQLHNGTLIRSTGVTDKYRTLHRHGSRASPVGLDEMLVARLVRGQLGSARIDSFEFFHELS
jgi:hypothetical protein